MKNLKNCIDCRCELNNDNRSKHQPAIRCLKCFTVFADKTRKTLEDMIKKHNNTIV